MRVEIIEPHGFCAGVTAALRKAESLRDAYCLHELVHNELVVASLRERGFRFVEDISEIPEGATVLFSAHGVSPAVRAEAERRRLRVVDATCPFVARVHQAARDFAARGLPVVVIGKSAHAEVKGIVGEVGKARVVGGAGELAALPRTDGPVGVVSQTTMNADEVKALVAELAKRFPVETMAEVCNATKVRQDAVKDFSRRHRGERGVGLLVLGSVTSSNTRRLCEVASLPRVYRAGTLEEVRRLDLAGLETLGVTSGASTPESFFAAAVDFLEKLK